MNADEVRYQVFVSSTFVDLVEERQKVLQAILQRKAFPAGMELFPSADEEQFEFIKREIDSSDYYIVIIAGRYGSISADGASYTEKEYDYAVSTGKPVLAFLHKDIGKLIGDKLESTDIAKAKLHEFRSKAARGRVLSFYTNSDELKSQVLISLMSAFDLRPMRGWTRAGQSSRADLETITLLQQRLLGSEAENRRLRELHADSTRMLSSGKDLAHWSLDVSDMQIETRPCPISSVEFQASWDDLLTTIFNSRPSSRSRDVKTAIYGMILDAFPRGSETDDWLKQAHEAQALTTSSAVICVYADVRRQFVALGLITETIETDDRTFGMLGPQNILFWKLTQAGEGHMAIIRGFVRQ